MKTKLMFLIILALILSGILVMSYGQDIAVDCLGAAILLAGFGIAVYRCVKRKEKAVLIPLVVSILAFIITGFIPFEGAILVAVFGFIALGLYSYLTVILNSRKSETEKH